MRLEDIGFYTLSDKRAMEASPSSPLSRCELILTDKCNFKCPYCRGLDKKISGTMPIGQAEAIVRMWGSDGLKNIRFSGGEPTVYPGLLYLVSVAKQVGIKRIAISTNGSASLERYIDLVKAGVNDISISLDACCASYGDKMAGKKGSWDNVVSNIKALSKLTYVTLGIVVTDETLPQLNDTIVFASSLDPSDIRIISSAQFNHILEAAQGLSGGILDRYQILKYRVDNIKHGRNVRGLCDKDSNKCGLCLDDMAVAGGYHFPCIIYMREGGGPIGKVGPNSRKERAKWYETHNTHSDPICSKNCLDVCVDYNNKFDKYKYANHGV